MGLSAGFSDSILSKHEGVAFERHLLQLPLRCKGWAHDFLRPVAAVGKKQQRVSHCRKIPLAPLQHMSKKYR